MPPPVITLGFPLLPTCPFLLEAHPKEHTVARAQLPPNPQHRIIYSELRNYIHYKRISRRKGRVRGPRHLRSAGHDRVVVYLSPERRCLLISRPPPQKKSTEVSLHDLYDMELSQFLCHPGVLPGSWPGTLCHLPTCFSSVAAGSPCAYDRESPHRMHLHLGSCLPPGSA